MEHRAYPGKLGRWAALFDESGRLLQMGRSHQANAMWAADHGFVLAVERLPEARQMDLFRTATGARQ